MKNNWRIYLLIVGYGLFAGCTKSTRSISHSDYREPGARYGCTPGDNISDPGFAYKGEISEFDVLGITREQVTSEEEIGRALDRANRVKLRPGSSILLIQSGAIFPDGEFVAELSKHYRVVHFSGVPAPCKTNSWGQSASLDAKGYSKSLRLAAARGANDYIICYWGILESGSEKLPTKTVSWLPVVNWLLPDAKQRMRIH